MRLLLIRHAETPANVAGTLETAHPGPGLTARGRRQAEDLAAALAHEPLDAIHVSTLVRTQLTAAPLAARLGIAPRVEEGLHEIEAGSLEGLSDHASVRSYLGTLRVWGEGSLGTAMPGGPDGNAFFRRFDAALERITERTPSGATTALISHGAAIRVWAGGRGRNVDPGFAAANDLANTGVVVAEGDPDAGWRILSWMGEPLGHPGEHSHDPQGGPFPA